jgi:protoheme IX farnesyltransferase
VRGYVALTKPRIIELLLVTTLPTMVVARRGIPSGWLILATLIGGALSAGGANATNMYIDRDIDAIMKRTSKRPLVTGAVSPLGALVFAIALQVVAFAVLWGEVNLISAVLAESAALFYIFVYSVGLKRRSAQNIVIGGAAGAVPVLVGWTAVTGRLAWAPILLFVLIVVWTPSHFWALAVKYRDDYAAAHVPMLPAVASVERVTREIVVYSAALLLVTSGFALVAHMGLVFWILSTAAGVVYVAYAVRLRRSGGSVKAAMALFKYSITYLTVIFGAMAVDVLVRAH